MKKKLATLLLSVCVVATVTGCGSKEISDKNITISQYKGVEVDKVAEGKVTKEDVENSIKSTQEANVITNEVKDRAVQDGDTATIDFVGKKDGVEFEGGSAKDYPLTVGASNFIEGFDTGLIGHNAGETFDLPLTFPAEYQVADLAGKDVVFTTTIKSIATKTVPELNDDFVKGVSKTSKTVAEYKKEVKKDLEKSNKETAKSTLSDEVSAAVVKNTKVTKYPKDQVTTMVSRIKDQYTQMASYSGLEFADFLDKQLGMTEAVFNEQAEKAAKETVKQELAINLIAKTEKIEPTEEEYTKAMKKYAKDYGFESVDAMKKQVDEKELKKLILQDEVKAWLVDHCKQVEPKKEDTTKTDTTKKDTTKKDTTKESK